MAGTSVAERLQDLKQRIEHAGALNRRKPDSVRLLAVSKLQSAALVREAFAAGQTDFAENYIQEALLKQRELADLKALRWHFIGRIQSNKVKLLAGNFYAIHSVDRVEILQALNRASQALNVVQDIFLQLNIAGEESKSGADVGQLEHLLTEAGKCDNLRVMGLMVMPPLDESAEKARPYFAKARELMRAQRALLNERHPFNELSMGTSGDYPAAIAEGATWVRIGTDVFGPREEKV
ncbi:MAG: YggS family pyridoxal phosphate-dependent enzyme [Bdellovibrionales bacterium]